LQDEAAAIWPLKEPRRHFCACARKHIVAGEGRTTTGENGAPIGVTPPVPELKLNIEI
jgi:hypothetical protein